MKKLLIILAIISVNAFAVDISFDTSKSQSTSADKTVSDKEGEEARDSQSKRKSETTTKDKTKSDSKELTKIGQFEIIDKIADFEEQKIQPFNECKIFSKPKLTADFGLTPIGRRGMIDSGKREVLEESAKSSLPIAKVGAKESDLKDYINCVSFYGALIAQALKTDTLDTDISDEEILRTYNKVQKSLAKNECRFDRDVSTIICGGVKIQIAYEPIVSYSNIPLFKEGTYYGYSLSERKSVSMSDRLAFEVSTSKENSYSTSSSKDSSRSSKSGNSQDKSFKTNLSPKSWLKF